MDRKNRIGGSDVAALFGLDPYKSYWRLWHEKAGNIEPEDVSDKDEVKFGVKIERSVAEWFCEENRFLLQKAEYIESKNVHGFGGEPDYIIKNKPREDGAGYANIARILEVKTTGYNSFKQWENGEPPLRYQLQLQTYMGLSGFKWGMLAILVDRKLLPPFEYEFRPKIFAGIEQKVVEFWQSIKEGREPDPTQADTNLAFLQRELSDETVDLSDHKELARLLSIYKSYDAAYRGANERRNIAKEDIKNLLLKEKIGAKRININGALLLTQTRKGDTVPPKPRKGGTVFLIKLPEENTGVDDAIVSQ